MKYILIFLVSFFARPAVNCQVPSGVKHGGRSHVDTIALFSDSMQIGIPGRHKLILAVTITNDSVQQASIQFYSKRANGWKLRYSYKDEHFIGHSTMPEIADFNNDGAKDFKYAKNNGARGGNSIGNLFIYDRKGDSLFFVINSNDYPNLFYNAPTKSINSYILTGANETVFLHLVGHQLRPFASIIQEDSKVTITEYNKEGKEMSMRIDSSGIYKPFARFTHFRPLKAE